MMNFVAVYLRTTPEVVYERIKKRARKEENTVSLEYLEQIHEIHEEWLYDRTLSTVPAKVITLDGNKDLEEMIKEFEICSNRIYSGTVHEEKKPIIDSRLTSPEMIKVGVCGSK